MVKTNVLFALASSIASFASLTSAACVDTSGDVKQDTPTVKTVLGPDAIKNLDPADDLDDLELKVTYTPRNVYSEGVPSTVFVYITDSPEDCAWELDFETGLTQDFDIPLSCFESSWDPREGYLYANLRYVHCKYYADNCDDVEYDGPSKTPFIDFRDTWFNGMDALISHPACDVLDSGKEFEVKFDLTGFESKERVQLGSRGTEEVLQTVFNGFRGMSELIEAPSHAACDSLSFEQCELLTTMPAGQVPPPSILSLPLTSGETTSARVIFRIGDDDAADLVSDTNPLNIEGDSVEIIYQKNGEDCLDSNNDFDSKDGCYSHDTDIEIIQFVPGSPLPSSNQLVYLEFDLLTFNPIESPPTIKKLECGAAPCDVIIKLQLKSLTDAEIDAQTRRLVDDESSAYYITSLKVGGSSASAGLAAPVVPIALGSMGVVACVALIAAVASKKRSLRKAPVEESSRV